MQLHWHTEPFLIISILGVAWLYTLLMGPLRSRFSGAPERMPWTAYNCFQTGLALAYISVASPLDQIGEQFLFSAHMVQHMILVYVCPPLMIYGLPWWLVDPLFRVKGLGLVFRKLFHPLVGGMTFSTVYTVWHIPLLYEMALQDKTIHIIEHLTMFGTGWMMLWMVFSQSKEIPISNPGVRMIGVFLLMVAQLPVFAFLTLSDAVLYPTYDWAPRIIPGFEALPDQILGGVIMKISNMVFSLSVFAYAFFTWAKHES
ncbi:MAG: cytochrome c oxidase assembly protein [Opitutales bacterium]|nr:cytochrome c oxidase assembly protein [Opitutales bacterium]NRA25647.1 cytochrome c oxidase assembly protein [Opitutales bacterium]